MAQTPEIQATQGGLTVVLRQAAVDVKTPQALALGVYNVPADAINATYAGANVAYVRQAQQMPVTQARVLAVVKGRVYNPKLRVWSYKLDGHKYYVLRLGDAATRVYDLSTGQWTKYTSGNLSVWRPNTGINWYNAGTIPETHGSNVICGDDTYGHLWVLNPKQGYDDDPPDPPGVPQRFNRRATGQAVVRGRVHLPVWAVYLTASAGEPVADGDTVTLEYSDDLGQTYVSAGAISVNDGEFKQQFPWRSLGQITQPGRLFRITDDGAFARIDSLDCSVGGTDG